MAEDLVVNYANDIVVKVRHNRAVRLELTEQGPRGPEGPIGTVTPELEAAKNAAIDAASRAATSETNADASEAQALAYRNTAGTHAATATDAKNDAVQAKTEAEAANSSAQSAMTAANTAKTDTLIAKTAAETARVGAEAAQNLANAAKADAETAKNAAELARTQSQSARTDAIDAKDGAVAANAAAQTAKTDSIAAKADLESARDTAVTAKNDAVTAKTAAEAANTAAQTAKTDATTAKTAAEAANTAAQTAKTDAQTARADAQTARTGAETAKSGADTAKTAAEAARDLAQQYAQAASEADPSDISYRNKPAPAAGTNLNSVIAQGIYAFAIAANVTTALNFPVASRTGVLTVTVSGSKIIQEYVDDQAANSWLRVSTDGGTSWVAWSAIWNATTLTAPSQTEAQSGTATATRAWTSQRVRENVAAYAAPLGHGHVVGDVSGLQAALDAKAPLASPALTGVPTAPTAPVGTNSNQIATMAAIRAALDNLVGAAPGAMDTLDELAAALGDDPNFATTITNALAGKANTNHVHDAANITTGRLSGDRLPVGLGWNANQDFTDWNDVRSNGWFMSSTAANSPNPGEWFIGIVTVHNSNWVIQEVSGFSMSNNADIRGWRRELRNGVWDTWAKVYKTEQALDARYQTNTAAIERSRGLKTSSLATGGGVISVNSNGRVKWSQRFITIALGGGWKDIYCPPEGHVIPCTDGTTINVEAAGVPLEGWASLWFDPTLADGYGLRIIRHDRGQEVFPNPDWVCICRNNGDHARYYFPNGIILAAGQSRNTANAVMTDAGGSFWGNISIENSGPILTLKDTDAAVDKKSWVIGSSNGELHFYKMKDDWTWLKTPLHINDAGVANFDYAPNINGQGLVWHQGSFDPNSKASLNATVHFSDITANRGDGTGAIFFGGAGNRYLYYNGSSYSLAGAGLTIGGNLIATDSTFSGLVGAGRIRSQYHDLYDASAGANLKTSRWASSLGYSRLQVMNDAYSSVTFEAIAVNHSNGDVTVSRLTSPVKVAAQGGNEGGEIQLAKAPTGSTLAGDVIVDMANDNFRVFEGAGGYRGVYIDLSKGAAGAGSRIWHEGIFNPAEELLQSVRYDGAGVSSVDLTITPGSHKNYRLVIKEAVPSAEPSGYLAIAVKIGGAWMTTPYYWNMLYTSQSTTAAKWGSDGYTYPGFVLGANVQSTTYKGASATVEMSSGKADPNGHEPQMSARYSYGANTGITSGYINSHAVVEGFRLFFTGTNVGRIEVQLYGLRG